MNKAFISVCALCLCVATTGAESGRETAVSTAAPVSGERTYTAADIKGASEVMSLLNRINLMEIELGNIAQENSASAAVRDYGAMLVNDHEASQDRVDDLAEKMDIALRDKDEVLAAKKIQTKIDRFKSLQSAAFDQAFAQAMVDDHSQAIEQLESVQKKVTGEAAQLVAQTLPHLRHHRQAAEKLLLDLGSAKQPS